MLKLGWAEVVQSRVAMERFELSVAIEVAVPRLSDGKELYGPYVQKLHEITKKHGGIPHWGQTQQLSKKDVEGLYAGSLEPFQWSLAELQGDGPATFSSPFTESRGLELEEGKTLADYRSQRSGGVLVSSMVPLLFA